MKKRFFFISELISKVLPDALKRSLESHSGAFSMVTLWAATLKLPEMIFAKIILKLSRQILFKLALLKNPQAGIERNITVSKEAHSYGKSRDFRYIQKKS